MEKSSAVPVQPSLSPSWGVYWELMRMHKFPLGSALAFFPLVWGLTMAAYREQINPNDYWWQVLYCSIGATILHSGACVINDICDVEFDRQIERTKNRPLATGRVSIFRAWILVALTVAPVVWMLSFLNTTAYTYGLITLFPLHGLYPLMKRWTWWPQAWLGMAFNMGIVIMWSSIAGNPHLISPPTILLGGSICWSIVYDSIYACMDRKDDVKAGVKSAALLFGEHIRLILMGFSAAFVFSLLISGWLNQQGPVFYILSVGGSIIFFIWQFSIWDENSAALCIKMFESHSYYFGYIVWSGLLLDYMML